MKKNIAVIALMVIMNILCGCSSAKDILLKTNDYSGVCLAVADGAVYELEITVGQGGNFTAQFTSPAQAAGLKYCFAGETLTVSYNGISHSVNTADAPAAGIAAAIRNGFIEAGRTEVWRQRTTDGKCIVQGNSDSGDFVFSFNSDGTPYALTIDELNFRAEFGG